MTPQSILDGAISLTKTGLRGFLQHRKKSLAAAAILAMGIGMSVAMFSLLDAVVLRPLPFPRQQSIDVISKVDPLAGKYVEEMAYPELRDLEENIHDFEFVAVMPTSLYGYARVLQKGNQSPVQIESTPVSHNFFRVLGVSPVLGRDFTAADERVGAAPVVMVSHRVWRDYLGNDPSIVGRMIRLNGQGYTVAGVLAPGVEFPRGAGFWYPLGVEKNVVERREATFLQAIVRVKPGVSHERISAEVDALVRRLASQYPDVYPLSQRAVVTPLSEYWTGSSRIHLWILLGASVLLFCTSIMGSSLLLISSVLGRTNEIATRIALGANGRQILSQLAAEGGFLALIAGLTGLGFAAVLIRLLAHVAPQDIPRLNQASLDSASILFALFAAVAAAVACTVMPGIPAIRMGVESVLREGSARVSLSRHGLRTRNFFILAQSSLTVVMLILAGLFLLSYRALISADIGFAHRDALSVNLQIRGPGLFASSRIDPKWRQNLYAHLLDRLREAPGVTSAAAVLVRPLEGTIGWERGYEFDFAAGKNKDAMLPKANYEVITPDYFRTVGTTLLTGRDFSEHDSEAGSPVVIISRNLAQQIETAGRSPVGQRIRLSGSPEWLTVVGVSANARYRSVAQQDENVFVPYRQSGAPTPYVVIRGTRSTQELSQLVRRVLASMDSSQAVAKDATLGELIDANMTRNRFNMTLLLWFAVCAIVLAITGIYGVIAETIAARKREIAIRLALGASRRRVMRTLVAKTLLFAFVGEAAGLCAVIPIYRWISELLYGVSPNSPPLLGAVLLLVSVACLIATCLPAWAAVDKKSILLS